MRKYIMTAAIAAALALAALDNASAAHAAGAVRGTNEQITFEGLVHKKQEASIPNGYDGLNWSGIGAIGKIIASQLPGYTAVLHGKVVAGNSSQTGGGSLGAISAMQGTFSFKFGHFAAACNTGLQITFSAYRSGTMIGTKVVTVDPADTRIRFDRTFSNIDTLKIQGAGGSGDCENVGMDNLVVKF